MAIAPTKSMGFCANTLFFLTALLLVNCTLLGLTDQKELIDIVYKTSDPLPVDREPYEDKMAKCTSSRILNA